MARSKGIFKITDKDYPKEFRNTMIAVAFAFLVCGFLFLFPEKKIFEGVVFTLLAMFSLVAIPVYPAMAKFATYKPKRKLSEMFLGFNEKPLWGFIIGIIAGIGFILLNSIGFLSIFSLAIPVLPLSLSSSAFVITIVAPLVETLFFAVLLHSILNLFMGFWLGAIIKAVCFCTYHIFSYVIVGSSTVSSVFGAFVGAFVFSMFGSLLTKKFGSETEWGAHSFINGWRWNQAFGFFSIV